MKMRTLGGTGLSVSPYCLGTMMFGPAGTPDPDDCGRILHGALDAGINFLDTADVYGGGETETILGSALKGRRDDVVLATKFAGPMGDDPYCRGASHRWIVTAVEDSLRRLDVDHIDLYQIHHYPTVTSAIIGPRTLEQLDDLLACATVSLSDEILDRIDESVAPGTDVGVSDVAYVPQSLSRPDLRRRAVGDRTAA